MTRIAIAVACALGASAAIAQSTPPAKSAAGAPAQTTVAQASSAAPIQTAQAGAAAGGAAGGASAGGAAAGGAMAAGTTVGTLTFIGAAAVSVAGASQNNSTTSH